MTAFIERVYRSLTYEIAFMLSDGPDEKGMCAMLNPNAEVGDPGHFYAMHETEQFPKGKTLFVSKDKLDALANEPDDMLPSLDLAVKTAWNKMRLCAKCGETLNLPR